MDLDKIKQTINQLKIDLRWLTPVGRSDNTLRKHIGEEPDTKAYQNYRKAFRRYRYTKRAEITFRIMLYAGLLTSIAAAVGLDQLKVLQTIAGYFGITLIILFYGISQYLNFHAREDFYLRRDIFLSEHNFEE